MRQITLKDVGKTAHHLINGAGVVGRYFGELAVVHATLPEGFKVVRGLDNLGGWYIDEAPSEEPIKLSHPEPQEFGAKATFTFHDGREMRLIRAGGTAFPWVTEFSRWSWDELVDMDNDEGSLVLGWSDEK